MRLIRAQTTADLAGINEALHDAWFDAEQIRFDSSSNELAIPFERQVILPVKDSRRTWLFDEVLRHSILCYLRISKVLEFLVNDTEKVRFYVLSDLRFVHKEVKIKTGVPIQLTIKVSSLCVEFEETDRVLEEQKGRRISFDLYSRPSKAFQEGIFR